MVKLKREIRRCGGCFWSWTGEYGCYCVEGSSKGCRVNAGWFGCRIWISLNQKALDLLRTSQNKRKGV